MQFGLKTSSDKNNSVCEWISPTHIALCFCFACLRLVYPMLPVSLDCPFLIDPSVFSSIYCRVWIYNSRMVCKICKVSNFVQCNARQRQYPNSDGIITASWRTLHDRLSRQSIQYNKNYITIAAEFWWRSPGAIRRASQVTACGCFSGVRVDQQIRGTLLERTMQS